MAIQISMDDRRHFAGRVESEFYKFMEYRLPVPVDPVTDIYRRAYSDKEWTAMRYLRQEKPDALANSRIFNLYWTKDVSGLSSCPHATFKFPKGTELPDFGVHLSDLPQAIQNKVRVWITSVQYFRLLKHELGMRINAAMGNPYAGHARTRQELDPCVNTPRQLQQLWPELQPFFYDSWKAECRVAAMRSRMPSEVGYKLLRIDPDCGTNAWTTPQQFRCEHYGCNATSKDRFIAINEILTRMSLAGHIERVKDWPTFSGDFD